MKKTLAFLTILAALAVFTPQVNASVQVTGYQYVPAESSFVIAVKATEPWVVWRTFDFHTWTRVSHVMGAGQKLWVDEGVGVTHPFGFYSVCPKGKHPNNGNHFGWEQPQNPHNQ